MMNQSAFYLMSRAMNNIEVVIDTCFLSHLSAEGSDVDSVIRIMNELGYSPVVHPYLVEHEFLYAYQKKLVKDGHIREMQYSDFLCDEADKRLYTEQFLQLLHEFVEYQMVNNSQKVPMDYKHLTMKDDIFKTHKCGSSMGDVHSMLMAWYLQLPIILTDDADIELLRFMANSQFNMDGFELAIYSSSDIVDSIANMENGVFTEKDIKHFQRNISEGMNNNKTKGKR